MMMVEASPRTAPIAASACVKGGLVSAVLDDCNSLDSNTCIRLNTDYDTDSSTLILTHTLEPLPSLQWEADLNENGKIDFNEFRAAYDSTVWRRSNNLSEVRGG